VTSGTNAVTATVSGTGVAPVNATDFVGGTFPTQTLTFTAGETSKTFAVQVQGDTTSEMDETGVVTLSSPTNGAVLAASQRDRTVFTIRNDDAALVGAFVWLTNTITAPALTGAPPSATYLKVSETADVTRSGITMKSRGSGNTAYDNTLFAGTPGFLHNNSFNGVDFTLAAGNWEVALIAGAFPFGGGISGSVRLVDDPNGAANVRQTVTYATSGAHLAASDGTTTFTDSATAVFDAVNNLVWLPATVSNLGSGTGLLRLQGNTGEVNIVAIALRQA
jgi:hypothetical protein